MSDEDFGPREPTIDVNKLANAIKAARVEVQWCTLCGARFTEEEIKGVMGCPSCGNKGVPCATGEDLSVTVNWHELRILGIWAENYAHHCDKTDPKANLTQTVHAITRRLQRQFPDKTSLTLSGEIMQVRDHGFQIEGYNVAQNQMIPVNGPGAIAPPSNG